MTSTSLTLQESLLLAAMCCFCSNLGVFGGQRVEVRFNQHDSVTCCVCRGKESQALWRSIAQEDTNVLHSSSLLMSLGVLWGKLQQDPVQVSHDFSQTGCWSCCLACLATSTLVQRHQIRPVPHLLESLRQVNIEVNSRKFSASFARHLFPGREHICVAS